MGIMAFGSFMIHAGDFKQGEDHQLVGNELRIKLPTKFFRERIKLDQIEEIEIASEDDVKRLGGTIGWGITGSLLLGPVGLLAGLLCGGKSKNITFFCKLKDGRKFMATASSKIYNKFVAAQFR